MDQHQPSKPWLSGTRRTIVGLLCIFGPWVVLVGVIMAYAISSFVIDATLGASTVQAREPELISADDFFGSESSLSLNENELSEPSLTSTAGSAIRVLLSIIGIGAILMIPIGGILGIYLLITNKD